MRFLFSFFAGGLERLYGRMTLWAEHPWALGILGLVAFSASLVFPFPPDPLFILIALQRPRQIPFLVTLCAGAQALGGLVMYGVGWGLYETVGVRIITFYGWEKAFNGLQSQLHEWGFLLLIAKAFTPIPYKLIALSYGVGHFDILQFALASFLGRGLRFGIEGVILWLFGPVLHVWIKGHLKGLATAFVLCVLGGFILLRLL
jgi:membrane protein YqaA with SNARE-associated domain